MNPSTLRGLIVAVALLAVAGGGYYLWQQRRAVPAPEVLPTASAPETQPSPQVGPAPESPAIASDSTALPSLAESDSLAGAELDGLLDDSTISERIEHDALIKRLVISLDSLPRGSIAQRFSPFRPLPGELTVSGDDDSGFSLSAENYARYEPYVSAFERIDSDLLVATYRRFAPLMQQAYAELIAPQGYFDERLVEIIDHLLAVQVAAAPPQLARPSVMFQYADPALEGRSVGAKLLTRMGRDNAARVQSKLREIRPLLARHSD
ncbi:MAG: DUF3014 domain-containing protein [Steroidobacteraceae bacterium]